MRTGAVSGLVSGLAALAFLAGCGGGETTPPAQPEQKAEKPAAPAPTPAPEPQQGNTPAEDLDPFVVMIGAERWTVILDRALEGSIEAEDKSGVLDQGDMYRADAALKQGAAMVIQLRNRVCSKGLLSADACKLPDWPAWTTELPTGDTPMEEIDRRSGWLSDVMSPFTSVACEAGRKASGDELFCSVE